MKNALKNALDETRLLIAERLIAFAAFVVAPRNHPDTVVLVHAVQEIAKRNLNRIRGA